MIDAILVLRDGKARVWRRSKGVRQSEMTRLVGLLRNVPGVEAFALAPDGPGLIAPVPPPPGTLAEILRAHQVRTYDLVEEASDLLVESQILGDVT